MITDGKQNEFIVARTQTMLEKKSTQKKALTNKFLDKNELIQKAAPQNMGIDQAEKEGKLILEKLKHGLVGLHLHHLNN